MIDTHVLNRGGPGVKGSSTGGWRVYAPLVRHETRSSLGTWVRLLASASQSSTILQVFPAEGFFRGGANMRADSGIRTAEASSSGVDHCESG